MGSGMKNISPHLFSTHHCIVRTAQSPLTEYLEQANSSNLFTRKGEVRIIDLGLWISSK